MSNTPPGTPWTYWILDPETTHTHAVGVRSAGETCLGSQDDPSDIEDITAWVRWDGCTFVTDNRNMPYHVCELEHEIGRWQELLAIALDYFGGAFCVAGMTEEYVAAYIRNHHNVVDALPVRLAIQGTSDTASGIASDTPSLLP